MLYSWYRWILPFKSNIKLGGRSYSKREGLYLKINDGNSVGWGEASPLPGFSLETLEDIIKIVKKKDYLSDISKLPSSLQFAIYNAKCDLQKQFDSPFKVASALLAVGDLDGILNQVRQAMDAGWQDFKIKIGRGNQDDEIKLVNCVAELTGAQHLRIDCNRAWNFAKAKRFMLSLKHKIAFIEEPTISPVYYNKLSKYQTIALDETLLRLNPEELSKATKGILVCKPTILANINRLLSEKWPLVISSALESPLGISHLAKLHSECSKLSAGLDTLNFFEADTLKKFHGNLKIDQGFIDVQERIIPKEEFLEQL